MRVLRVLDPFAFIFAVRVCILFIILQKPPSRENKCQVKSQHTVCHVQVRVYLLEQSYEKSVFIRETKLISRDQVHVSPNLWCWFICGCMLVQHIASSEMSVSN